MKYADLTRFVHSKGFAGLMLGLALGAFILTYSLGLYTPVSADKGLILPSANEWIAPGPADLLISLAANVALVLAAALTAKFFNILRSQTALPMALFATLQMATPGLGVQFYTGTALAIAVAGCLMILFSCYRCPVRTRRIFLIFLILSTGCATQYCYVLYIPVFLLGCGQMRIFNSRTIVAALLGLITPWWIMGACGLLRPDTIHMPELVNIFSQIPSASAISLLTAVGLTALLLVGSFTMNVMKTIAYNARARAYSGAFATLSLATLIGMAIDYQNLISYVPLLNYCASFETAGYFSTHRGERTGLAPIIIAATYLALYLCQILL
ncbi:MAG: hypothetical protein K2M06_03615 [Muribaculaceae bacterium]|nr:hypothetical protein [Muribaculaceae bacterium]